MKADVKTLSDLTVGDVRYLVPRYQRPYVWTEDKHWGPLWDDVEAGFTHFEAGEERDHFLGAIVLQEDSTPPGEPTRYQLIDGQQRMTTTQVLLAAAANIAYECGADKVGRLLSKMVLNDADVAEGDDRFKLWPTASDRHAFRLVATPGGPPIDAENDPENTIQEAYDYFRRRITEFAVGDGSDPEWTATRLDGLRSVISGVFKIVAIRLEGNDEAQVIFETLNARGTPLLAMDLVKNAVFLAADHAKEPTASLHDEVWEPELGRSYWRDEIRQGRLTRPRAELFLIHWMTMKLGLTGTLGKPIRSDLVFRTFSTEILNDPNSPGPADLIKELVNDAKVMRRLDDVDPRSVAGRFFRTTDYLDSSMFLPLALYLFVSPRVSEADRDECLRILESVQVRRALMGLSGKAYSQIVVELLRRIGPNPEAVAPVLREFFTRSDVKRSSWPSDEELSKRLRNRPIYGWVSRQKVVGLLTEIELELRKDSKTEDVALTDHSLSIEHVMPQTWEKNWPLENGSLEATEQRNEVVQVLGNLTLATGALNSSLSNQPWKKKRARLGKHSLLLMNRDLSAHEAWDEAAIADRGSMLTGRILKLWPGPDPSELAAFAGDPSPVEVNPERGEMPAGDALDCYRDGTAMLRDLLADLAIHPEKKRTFGEVEAGLGWPTGTLASVLGGFARKQTQSFNGNRPFRTGQDGNGTWWIWMDSERAELIRSEE